MPRYLSYATRVKLAAARKAKEQERIEQKEERRELRTVARQIKETNPFDDPKQHRGRAEPHEGMIVQISIHVGEHMVSLLRAFAKLQGRSTSDVCREAIREYLAARDVVIYE